jgi:hypothetical protein
MHSTFVFLIDLEDPEDDGHLLDIEAGTVLDSEYLHLCDENNWYTRMALVTKTGCVVQLCDDDDWRERFELARSFEEMPPEKRWESALRFAREMAAADLTGEWEWDGEEEIDLADLADKARDFIAENIRSREEKYHCAWRMEALASLDDAIVEPFCASVNDPYYEWHCYDLRYDKVREVGDNAAIVFVDIHT